MKFTNLINNVFYRYKIEKYDLKYDSWSFEYGFFDFISAKRVFTVLKEYGIYRLIKCYDIKELKESEEN